MLLPAYMETKPQSFLAYTLLHCSIILDEFSQLNKEEVEAILIEDKFIKYLSSCGSWSNTGVKLLIMSEFFLNKQNASQ